MPAAARETGATGFAVSLLSCPAQHPYPYANVRMPKRKDTVVGVLLAVFGGTLGLHRFYLDDPRGWLYVLLCWTGLPTAIGLLEAFDIPRRVRVYNASAAEDDRRRMRWIDKLRREK